jgi:hypothetical protein
MVVGRRLLPPTPVRGCMELQPTAEHSSRTPGSQPRLQRSGHCLAAAAAASPSKRAARLLLCPSRQVHGWSPPQNSSSTSLGQQQPQSSSSTCRQPAAVRTPRQKAWQTAGRSAQQQRQQQCQPHQCSSLLPLSARAGRWQCSRQQAPPQQVLRGLACKLLQQTSRQKQNRQHQQRRWTNRQQQWQERPQGPLWLAVAAAHC